MPNNAGILGFTIPVPVLPHMANDDFSDCITLTNNAMPDQKERCQPRAVLQRTLSFLSHCSHCSHVRFYIHSEFFYVLPITESSPTYRQGEPMSPC